ncbi:MAG: GldG family protein [Verrucomicrobiota bacterium]
MQKKNFETLLYSSAGVAAMLVLLVALNVLTGAAPVRVDLTRDKAFTLSDGTRSLLRQLPAPVKVRFYCTQSDIATPESVFLKDYARKVEDLLHEYQQVAGHNLVIERYDPQPDSDAEDSARLDGLESQPLPGGDRFYLGLAVVQADQRVAIPFLEPDRENLLEYDLTRAIARVQAPRKATVGILSSLPVFGAPSNPMMMQMGQRGSPPWLLVEQLQQDFNVKPVDPGADKIDDDIQVLLVIHPKGIPEKTQFAIDQFVLRGGRLIAFLDPQSALDSRQRNPMMGGPAPAASSLERLLKSWGLQFDTGKVVADLDFMMQLRGRDNQPADAPAWIAVTADGINKDDIATSQVTSLWMPMTGAFTGSAAAGLQETVLVHSSKDAQLVDAFLAGMDSQAVLTGFKPAGVQYALAVRLDGKFKTAFPDGPPASGETNAPAGTNAVAAGFLLESKTNTAVVLVGDSDMLADDFSVRRMNSPFGEMVSRLNANLDFAQNLVEQMAGDSRLIGLRSRATQSRPFTRIRKMEAQAQAQGQAQIDELRQSLSETQRRISELEQQKGDKDQRLVESPEQRAEVDKFKKKYAEVNRQLKQAGKDLHKEVASMETRIRWLNILAMPFAVTAAGIAVAAVQRRKTSAK